jgi:hypothetical protein
MQVLDVLPRAQPSPAVAASLAKRQHNGNSTYIAAGNSTFPEPFLF